MTDIKLSILLLTYNHGKYLEQCLNSIIEQKTNFEYEVIICDDTSTDDTRKIILAYKDRFKNIQLQLNKCNYGLGINAGKGLQKIRGKYFHIIEGDDYLTDNNKFQKQVDFLEANNDYVGATHDVNCYMEQENRFEDLYKYQKPSDVTPDNVDYHIPYYHTSSAMFRSNLISKLFYNNLRTDWFISIYFSNLGKIKFLDEKMSVYRVTGHGIWSKLAQEDKDYMNIKSMFFYNVLFDYKYNSVFSKKITIWIEEVEKKLSMENKTPKHEREYSLLKKILSSDGCRKFLNYKFFFLNKMLFGKYSLFTDYYKMKFLGFLYR